MLTMEITAAFELEAEEARIRTIYASLKEERDEGMDRKRSSVALDLEGTTLQLTLSGDDLIGLRAAANTWLRLVKVADEMVQVVRECGSHGS
jgi:tRNA threonylcarbamoyladenosine modification (KEOPS) complex  Pcc1 subunit